MTKSPSAAARQPPLDDRPGLQIVGQRDGAEIVAERRAKASRRRLHGRDARGHARRRARAIRAFPRSPRTRPQPWRTRRDRRRTRPRPRDPPSPVAGRAARGRARRDCRSRARAGRTAASSARHRPRSRRRRTPRRSRAPLPGVIQSAGPGPRPTIATRPVTAAAPARDEDHREIRRGRVVLVGERHDALVRPWSRARHRSPGPPCRPIASASRRGRDCGRSS